MVKKCKYDRIGDEPSKAHDLKARFRFIVKTIALNSYRDK